MITGRELTRAFCTPLALIAAPALAQQTEPPIIVVTGEGLEAPPGTAAYGSVEIDRQRLINDASGRLENILADVAGFQQFRRSDNRASNPSAQGITLRALGGNASSRALILLDGVPRSDPFFGYIPFNALDPTRLSHVRITRGGGAGPFGAGAVAGTIELTSGGPDDLPGVSGRAFYGSRDSTELAAGLNQRLGDGFASLSGRWDRGDGFFTTPARQRTPRDVRAAYESWSTSARAVIATNAATEIQASGLIFDDRRTLRFADADSSSEGADASLRFVSRGRWGVDAIAYVQARNFTNRVISSGTGRLVLDQYNTPATGLGGKIELRPPVGGGHLVRVGADLRRSSGQLYEKNFNAMSGEQTTARTAGGAVTTIGAFVENDWTLGRLILTGGARIDRWTIRDGFLQERAVPSRTLNQDLTFPDRGGWRATGRVGALYSLSDAANLRAAAYTGFRVPTLNELYRPFRVFPDATAANADLELEKLKGVEGGIDLAPAAGARIGLTAFYNRLEDAVANVTVAAGPGVFPQVGFVPADGVFRQRHNVDAIEVYGIEATAGFNIGDFALSGSYAFNHATVDASGLAAALDGKRPAQSPRHAGSVTLAWAPRSGAYASATLRYVGTQYEDDLESEALPPALTVDLVASAPVAQGISVMARAENVFDEEIVTRISGDAIDRGTPRTLWIGLTFELSAASSRSPPQRSKATGWSGGHPERDDRSSTRHRPSA